MLRNNKGSGNSKLVKHAGASSDRRKSLYLYAIRKETPMTSISSNLPATTRPSPLDRLKNELANEIQAGTVNSADQSALSSALDSINASLQADGSSQTGTSRA